MDKTISRIETILAGDLINLPSNANVKEGYTEAIQVLKEGAKPYSEIRSESLQARAIVALAIDLRNGQGSAEVLCNVPLRRK